MDIMTGLTPWLTFSYPPYQTHTGFHSGLRVVVSADGGGTSGPMGSETKESSPVAFLPVSQLGLSIVRDRGKMSLLSSPDRV